MDKTINYEDFINVFTSIQNEYDLPFHEKLALMSLYEISQFDLAKKLSKFILKELFDSKGIQKRKINQKEINILKFHPGFQIEDSDSIRYMNIFIEK